MDPDVLRREIDAARTNGWAICDQELEEGLRAIAVPLHNRDGGVVAALNLSSHVVRRSVQALQRDLLPTLLATARQVEAEIRVSPHASRRARS